MAIRRAIANGKLDLVISYILYSENKRGPNKMAKDYNLDFMKKYHKFYVGTDKLDSLQPLITDIVTEIYFHSETKWNYLRLFRSLN